MYLAVKIHTLPVRAKISDVRRCVVWHLFLSDSQRKMDSETSKCLVCPSSARQDYFPGYEITQSGVHSVEAIATFEEASNLKKPQDEDRELY